MSNPHSTKESSGRGGYPFIDGGSLGWGETFKWTVVVTINTFLSTDLALFLEVHLILLQHVIILSQDMLSFIYFLMRSLSPLCYHSLPLISVLCMAMFTSLPF